MEQTDEIASFYDLVDWDQIEHVDQNASIELHLPALDGVNIPSIQPDPMDGVAAQDFAMIEDGTSSSIADWIATLPEVLSGYEEFNCGPGEVAVDPITEPDIANVATTSQEHEVLRVEFAVPGPVSPRPPAIGTGGRHNIAALDQASTRDPPLAPSRLRTKEPYAHLVSHSDVAWRHHAAMSELLGPGGRFPIADDIATMETREANEAIPDHAILRQLLASIQQDAQSLQRRLDELRPYLHEKLLRDDSDTAYGRHRKTSRALSCRYCEMQFTRYCDRRKHMARKHASPETREHACPHCDRRFLYPKDLRRHLKCVHKAAAVDVGFAMVALPARYASLVPYLMRKVNRSKTGRGECRCLECLVHECVSQALDPTLGRRQRCGPTRRSRNAMFGTWWRVASDWDSESENESDAGLD